MYRYSIEVGASLPVDKRVLRHVLGEKLAGDELVGNAVAKGGEQLAALAPGRQLLHVLQLCLAVNDHLGAQPVNPNSQRGEMFFNY